MSLGKRLVTIGVPVYNGEVLFARTLDSLLGQSYDALDIVISDNASTDATAAICEDYGRRDARIRYFRQPANLGAPANWNFVAQQARGAYFKWASASDLCHPDMVARCVRVLDEQPDVALCYGRTVFIDDEDRAMGEAVADFAVLEQRPADRFRRICHELRLNNAQSGLIRSESLRRTHLDRRYPHGDKVLMAELALQGKFVLLDDVLLFRRGDAAHFTGKRSAQDMVQMFRPGARQQLPFLSWRRHLDYLFSALAAPLPWSERLAAGRAALQSLYWGRRGLQDDLVDELRRLFPDSDRTSH